MVKSKHVTMTNGGHRENKKKDKKGKGKSVKIQGIQSLKGITQSTALTVTTAFGDSPKASTLANGLDAFNACHVPLPRATGSYTVIRTTQIVDAAAAVNLFGPYSQVTVVPTGSGPGIGQWTQTCCVQSVDPTLAINANNNAFLQQFRAMTTGDWGSSRVTPAAFSIQVMNPEALQTTTGMVYIGRARQMLNLGGSTRTWNDLSNQLISYSEPRICAAGKLAFRGVQVDGVPYDMNALADFRCLPTVSPVSGPFTWTAEQRACDGFAPIFVLNPDKIKLQVLVCCEWRVRFDPENPAYASHTYHGSSTEGFWDKLQQYAAMLGNGAMDIAEKVGPQLVQMSMNRAQGSRIGYPGY